MSKIHTDLEVHVTLLQDYYENCEYQSRYYISYYPARLVYQGDLHNCNSIVQEYAFKHQMANTIEDVVKSIKDLYVKVLEEDYMRLDVLFEATDAAHLSNERRHDSSARIILDKKYIAYNKQISEEDRSFILNEMLDFRKYTSIKKINC